MAVPKRKKSVSRKKQRRSHLALKPSNLMENSLTGNICRSHIMDSDGFYNGRQVRAGKMSDSDDNGDDNNVIIDQ
jgi:ribosomal protein L32